jgi:hypothetical protein
MATRRHRFSKKNRTRKMQGGKKFKNNKKSKTGKKWVTAIDAASATLKKTGSITSARESLRKQALFNARRLFGAVGGV